MINLIFDPISITLVSIIITLLLRIQKNLGILEASLKDTIKEIERIRNELDNMHQRVDNQEFRILKIETMDKKK